MVCNTSLVSNVTRYALMIATLMLAACSGGSGGSSESVGGASGAVQVLQITGVIRFEDKEYGAYGFNGNTQFKPVRFAIVDLVDAGNRVIDTTVTDESGNYTLVGSVTNTRVRVLAQTGASVAATITIHDHDGNVYAVSQALSNEETSLEINIDAESDVAG
ncbi:hypothetical protein, partial [Kaarinaea lacus]